jgi:hypothetical protein
MKHSPAPWTEDPEGEVAVTIEDANGNPIADVYGSADDNPNARLIAAAPLLLEALIDALDMIHRIQGEPEYYDLNECFLRRDKIGAAIAATQQATV